jgi:anti-sigma28 factor (negative regulator of flagellin synthesis)
MVSAAVSDTPPGRDVWLASLRDAIRRGEYRVDPHAVAEAALRHDGFRQQLLS